MFTIGDIYNRREDLHDQFGGNPQSGISPCANHPYVFLFSSPKGEEYGYEDGWASEKEYLYTGEGWRGNMEMLRGNKAIYKHQEQGRELHLFEKVAQGEYRYVGEFVYESYQRKQGKDVEGHYRSIIVFRLRKVVIN